MPELVQAAQQKVYAPTRTIQVWKSLLNWLAFFFQIFLQILRGNTSLLSSYNQLKPLPEDDAPPHPPPPSSVALSTLQITTGSVPFSVDVEGLQKLTVVLDLDETLICAYETSSLPASVCSQATEAGLKWFELECVSSDKEYDGKPKINYVTVFERPGLHKFLEQLSEFADLVLFTAGLEGYARPLVDKIDLGNRFRHRLYRPSTISTKFRDHVKDLSGISKDLSRIVIVDNNPFSFLLQPLNGVPCISFSPDQPHDEQLLEVILPLLKHLSEQKDVRPVLHERFHMPEWFQEHGIPASGMTNV